MALQTSVLPVLSMDDLQVVFTTSNDPHNPHNWITFSRVTPAAVVGKLVKPAKTITKKPPKEKTEAKIDHFNPEIVDKAIDNTRALDDDEIQAGMRSRCVWYKNGNRTVQYTSKGYAGWCGQRSVARARSGLPYARPIQTKFKGSNGTSPKRHSTMKNAAANILIIVFQRLPRLLLMLPRRVRILRKSIEILVLLLGHLVTSSHLDRVIYQLRVVAP